MWLGAHVPRRSRRRLGHAAEQNLMSNPTPEKEQEKETGDGKVLEMAMHLNDCFAHMSASTGRRKIEDGRKTTLLLEGL